MSSAEILEECAAVILNGLKVSRKNLRLFCDSIQDLKKHKKNWKVSAVRATGKKKKRKEICAPYFLLCSGATY